MRYLLLAAIVLSALIAQSQNILPTPRNIQSSYDKGTRSVDGKPGKNYWQNSALYSLDIHYLPAIRLLTGTATIIYTNNSPDTLRSVMIHLNANYYKKGVARDRTIDANDEGEGIVIDEAEVDDKPYDPSLFAKAGTIFQLKVDPILPHQERKFYFNYHYTLNKGSHNRTGEIEPGAAFVAYFFPRIAVYDDRDGWNTFPYDGGLEFYNDFSDFYLAVTVPNNFVVWATGDLKNKQEVLAPAIYEKLQQAESADSIITVIDSSDIKKGSVTAKKEAFNTWYFDAKMVTDVAFAISDHYVWQSSSVVVDPATKRRTRVDAVFNPKHKDYFMVASDARKTVESMSYIFPAWPYPYSHETVFDGLDQMEYPMMVNDNPVDDRAESIELTDHEIFHTMFPFYMGINETKYAWMDEGWATIGEWLISPLIDSSLVDEYGIKPTALNAGTETDLPVMTVSTELNKSYFTNAYPKPALGYLYIRDYLGDELFKKALHNYISNWHGKHPMPNDFFYSMNEGSGKNLNWFWRKWFFEGGIPDLAIQSVKQGGSSTTIVIANKGGRPVPVDLLVSYADGSTEKIHRTIGVWERGELNTTILIKGSKKIAKLELNDPHTPDSHPEDNHLDLK